MDNAKSKKVIWKKRHFLHMVPLPALFYMNWDTNNRVFASGLSTGMRTSPSTAKQHSRAGTENCFHVCSSTAEQLGISKEKKFATHQSYFKGRDRQTTACHCPRQETWAASPPTGQRGCAIHLVNVFPSLASTKQCRPAWTLAKATSWFHGKCCGIWPHVTRTPALRCVGKGQLS